MNRARSGHSDGIFRGRISRLGYIVFTGYCVLAFCLIIVVVALLGALTPADSAPRAADQVIVFLLTAIVTAAFTFFGISVTIRRWHDIGQSGWMLLLSLVPVASFVVGVMMFVMPGTSGPNKYGPKYSGGYGPLRVLGLK